MTFFIGLSILATVVAYAVRSDQIALRHNAQNDAANYKSLYTAGIATLTIGAFLIAGCIKIGEIILGLWRMW